MATARRRTAPGPLRRRKADQQRLHQLAPSGHHLVVQPLRADAPLHRQGHGCDIRTLNFTKSSDSAAENASNPFTVDGSRTRPQSRRHDGHVVNGRSAIAEATQWVLDGFAARGAIAPTRGIGRASLKAELIIFCIPTFGHHNNGILYCGPLFAYCCT